MKAEGISGGEEVGKQVGVSPAPHPSAGQTAALCLTKCFSSSGRVGNGNKVRQLRIHRDPLERPPFLRDLLFSVAPSSLPADLIVRRALSGADPIWEGTNVGGPQK